LRRADPRLSLRHQRALAALLQDNKLAYRIEASLADISIDKRI
jgi:hypothetical protein